MKKIRLGVLGVGPRMRALLPVYFQHDGVEIVALCDQYLRNMDAAKREMPYLHGVPCVTSYEELIKRYPMDALMITVTPYQQVQYACDAMARGIHVMTEVPCAFTVKDCERLAAAVRKTGCVYQLAEQTRYMHFIAEWRRMYGEGVFGDMLLMEGEYMHYERWDNQLDIETGELFYNADTREPPSYGAFAISSQPAEHRRVERTWRYECMKHPILYLPHELSPLLSVTDDEIIKVSCMGTRAGSYDDPQTLPETRDLETALMYTRKGTILRVSAGFTTPHGPRRETGNHWYHVKGAKASAEWSRSDHDLPKFWSQANARWQERADWTLLSPNAPAQAKQSGHGGLDWYPLNEFVNAIREKRQPWMNVNRAIGTALPAILAAQSAEQGGVLIDVPKL